MITINTKEVADMLGKGSKVLSWHVVTELSIAPRRIIEEALDWAADLKTVTYLQAYKAQRNTYPRVIRYAYLKHNGKRDVYIVNKDGKVII